MISGKTTLIAHLGYPTFAFKAPLIYNPWFEKNGIDAVVVPMGVQVPDYPDFFRSLFHLTNIRGALVTMPHKVTTISLVDEITPFLRAAQDKGCPIQVGKDMLFEQIPAYLEFFGFGTATPEELRAVAKVEG